LLDDVILSLCRLTDPPRSCGRDNIVLERVADGIAAYGDTTLAAAVKEHLDQARTRCAPFREHRNQRLAHADLQVAVFRSPLAGYSRDTVEQALESVRNFMNTIGEYFFGVPTDFRVPGVLLGEANSLVYALRQATAYRKHQLAGLVNP